MERLREAILERDIDEVQSLLKNNAFGMPGEEMDELLKQLGTKNIQTLQKRMSSEREVVGTQKIETLQNGMSSEREVVHVLSKEAQLKVASESNDPVHFHLILETLKCRSQLKASTIASIAMYDMRANLQPNYGIIDLLLQCASDVEPRLWDSKVALPILYAVLSELPAALRKKLLQLPVATSRSVAVAILHLAVKSGNISVVEEIISDPDLSIGVDDVYAGDSHRATALLRASHHGLPDMVAYLISCGADVRKRDRNGRTALHLASAQGHDSVVRVLLQEIGDPVRFATVSALRRRRQEAHQNEEEAEEEMVQQLTVASGVEEVTSIDAVDEWGMSALHLAVCGGHAEVVRSLLDGGADPSIRAPHQSQSQSSFVFFVDTYFTICRKEVIDYEDLYRHTSSTTKKKKVKDVGNVQERFPRNDCFRLSPVMSVYWHPGGFTALHFAVAYAKSRLNNDAVLQSLLPLSEDLRRMRDSNGLTAVDWAVGMQLLNLDDGEGRQTQGGGDGKEIIHILEFEGCSAANVVVDDSMRYTVTRYKQVLKTMEERKQEMEWGDRMGSALRNGEFVVAEGLAKEHQRWIKQPLGQDTIEHVRWAASEPAPAIREQWRWDYEARRFVVPVNEWGWRVEKVMVELMKEEAAAVMMDAADLQKFLVWALRNRMQDLGIVLCRRKDCELLVPLRGSIAPLHVHNHLEGGARDIQPVLQAMEARSDVRERLSQIRQQKNNLLNALLVVSALLGGLAFTAMLQPPFSFQNNTLEHNSNNWSASRSLTKSYINSASFSFLFSTVAMLTGIAEASASIAGCSGRLAFRLRMLTLTFMWLAMLTIWISYQLVQLTWWNDRRERRLTEAFAILLVCFGCITTLLTGLATTMFMWRRPREIELHLRMRRRRRTWLTPVLIVDFWVLRPMLGLLKVPLSRRYIKRSSYLEAGVKMFCPEISAEDIDFVISFVNARESSLPPSSLFL